MVEFRDYFDNLLKENGYKEEKDGFYNGVASTKYNDSYFLSYSFPSILRTGNNVVEYTSNVTIDFFFSGKRSVQETMDRSVDKVNDMGINFINNYYKVPNCFRSIDIDSISIRDLDNNSRNMVITLEITAIFNRSLN